MALFALQHNSLVPIRLLAILFCFTSSFCCDLLHARGQLLVLNDKADVYKCEGYEMDVFVDSTGRKTLADIQKLPTASFGKPKWETRKSNGYRFPIWVKFNYTNRSKESSWLYELVDFRIDHVTFFSPNKQAGYDSLHQGDDVQFGKKIFQHKNQVFKLASGNIDDTLTVYIRFDATQDREFILTAKVRSITNFSRYSLNEYFLLALFYGMISIMALYNLFLYFSLKDKVHLVYVFYIVNVAVYCSSRIDGLGFQFLWRNFPSFNEYLDSFSLAAFVVCAMWFAMTFLETEKQSTLSHVLLKSAMFLRVFVLLVGQFYHPVLDYEWIDLFCVLLTLGVSIKACQNQFKKYRYFLLAFGLMSVGFSVFALQELGMIPNNMITFYSLNIGIICESFFLSLGISEKTRRFMEERNTAQQNEIKSLQANSLLSEALLLQTQEKKELAEKVNRELEQKVADRTTELRTLNENLALQKEQIATLNSMLDIQNWELKKELKEKEKAQIIPKHLNLEEFQNTFPDDSSCYRYLADWKWGKGDEACSNCGNIKWKRINLKSRKCTRCDHIESVTSHTIFHGVRFSIQKAFFIAYQYLHFGESLNITELANKLDMRRPTCSAFVQKVREKKDKLKPNESLDFGKIVF
jgi:two-component system, sensor histidine kinase LadS